MNSLTNQRFISNIKPQIYIIVGLVKVTLFLYLLPTNELGWQIAIDGGDTESYLRPIENLIEYGSYTPDYRLPGYGMIFFVLRAFFQSETAQTILVLLQWLISTISIFYLAESIYTITRNERLSFLGLALYTISTSSNTFDYFLLTESFTTSFLIFGTYQFLKYLERSKLQNLIWSSVFISWASLMRPVLFPLIGVLIILSIVKGYQAGDLFKSRLKKVLLIIIPILIFELYWIPRNYRIYGKLLPLNTSYYPLDLQNSYLNELMGFVISWGGDRTWWNPNAEIRWFFDPNESQFGRYTGSLPDNIYTSRFNMDSLLAIKKAIRDLPQSDDRISAEAKIRRSLESFTESIKIERPFLFHFKSKLKLLIKFLWHPGTPYLFSKPFEELSVVDKALKVFYSGLYVIVFALGAGSTIRLLFLYVRGRARILILLVPLITLYLIFAHAVLGHIEYRYLVPIYPMMIINMLTFSPLDLYSRNRKNRSS